MSKKISDLEKEIGEIKDEPNQAEIDKKATELLKQQLQDRKDDK